jgi:hypothetical protein
MNNYEGYIRFWDVSAYLEKYSPAQYKKLIRMGLDL